MGASPKTIIALAIGFVLCGVLIPIALEAIAATKTGDWDPTVITIFTILLPILFVIGLAIRYIPGGKGD